MLKNVHRGLLMPSYGTQGATAAMASSRPRRQCVERRMAVPSAVHYLGYVEDEETPEMIMKKFEAMEQVMESAKQGQQSSNKEPDHQAPVAGGSQEHGHVQPSAKDGVLDDALLLQVFCHTSKLTSRSATAHAQAGGAWPFSQGGVEGPGPGFLSGQDSGSEPDPHADADSAAGSKSKAKPKRKRVKTEAGGQTKRAGSMGREGHVSQRRFLGMPTKERNILGQVLMQTNRDSHALIRRKPPPADAHARDEIFQLRIPPPPLPTAWGRSVRPWDPINSLSLRPPACSLPSQPPANSLSLYPPVTSLSLHPHTNPLSTLAQPCSVELQAQPGNCGLPSLAVPGQGSQGGPCWASPPPPLRSTCHPQLTTHAAHAVDLGASLAWGRGVSDEGPTPALVPQDVGARSNGHPQHTAHTAPADRGAEARPAPAMVLQDVGAILDSLQQAMDCGQLQCGMEGGQLGQLIVERLGQEQPTVGQLGQGQLTVGQLGQGQPGVGRLVQGWPAVGQLDLGWAEPKGEEASMYAGRPHREQGGGTAGTSYRIWHSENLPSCASALAPLPPQSGLAPLPPYFSLAPVPPPPALVPLPPSYSLAPLPPPFGHHITQALQTSEHPTIGPGATHAAQHQGWEPGVGAGNRQAGKTAGKWEPGATTGVGNARPLAAGQGSGEERGSQEVAGSGALTLHTLTLLAPIAPAPTPSAPALLATTLPAPPAPPHHYLLAPPVPALPAPALLAPAPPAPAPPALASPAPGAPSLTAALDWLAAAHGEGGTDPPQEVDPLCQPGPSSAPALQWASTQSVLQSSVQQQASQQQARQQQQASQQHQWANTQLTSQLGAQQQAALQQQQHQEPLIGQAGSAPGQGYIETHSIASLNLPALLGRSFSVVMVNMGWEVPGCGDDDTRLLSRLSKVPMLRLCPHGFVFVWTRKHNIQAACRLLYAWGYSYIENLTWVWLHPNNTIARLPSQQPLACSHLTLLMFRKEGEGKDIQLRHQRNADVVLDCVRHSPGCPHAPPPEVYATLETMLPGEVASGSCLELWAAQGSARQGWTRVLELGAE